MRCCKSVSDKTERAHSLLSATLHSQSEGSKVTLRSEVRCPTLEVLIDLAAQQPLSSHFRDHVGRDKRGWEQADGVGAVALVQQGASLEKGAVDIHLVTDAKQVPGDSAVLAQLDSRQITKGVPINYWQETNE